MFTFLRSASSPAEVWLILLPENSRPNATKRFGAAVIYEGTEFKKGPPKCHEIGTLVVLRREREVEILVGGKNGLTAEEERMLSFQIESLVGAHVHEGSEPVQGWYWHDSLRPA